MGANVVPARLPLHKSAGRYHIGDHVDACRSGTGWPFRAVRAQAVTTLVILWKYVDMISAGGFMWGRPSQYPIYILYIHMVTSVVLAGLALCKIAGQYYIGDHVEVCSCGTSWPYCVG